MKRLLTACGGGLAAAVRAVGWTCARLWGLPARFPFGKAPLWIAVAGVLAGGGIVATRIYRAAHETRPDLIFLTFARPHFKSYLKPVKEFEKGHDVKVRMELVGGRALQSRLQSALLAGTEVPDVAEIEQGSIHYFIRGPLEDVGFLDITDRLIEDGYWHPDRPERENRLVGPRLSIWMSRGRVFALPHDVHPVCLVYRADVMEQVLSEPDVRSRHPDIRSAEDLDTWEEFVSFGRSLTKDLDGDGIPDRYALDLSSNGGGTLRILLLQRGGSLFTRDGQVAFDSRIVADTVYWYVHQIEGPDRVAFSAGWGQTVAKAVLDGLVVFYFCPDWRSKFFENDVPTMKGKMRLMPLPAWEAGGRRTSVWGGTGMVITKACKDPDLAWELCKFLYFDTKELGKRFQDTNIIPPFKDAWDIDELKQPNAFYGGQKIGQIYAALAPNTPPDWRTAYTQLAQQKLDEAFANCLIEYKTTVLTEDGPAEREEAEAALRKFIRKELKRVADYVRRTMAHNVFLKAGQPQRPSSRSAEGGGR